MNLLTRLIRARAGTVGNLSATLGIGYHSLFKVVAKTPYWAKLNIPGCYSARYIRQAVAEWLGLPYEHVWGPNAAAYLKPLLKKEIEQQIGRRRRLRKSKNYRPLGFKARAG